MQGFSLFKVVLLCDVTSNTMLFLLKSKGTAIYYIFISKPKKIKIKKLGGLEGLRSLYSKATFKKEKKKSMAAPKFLFLKSELILCNIFSPFLFFRCAGFHQSLSGGTGQMQNFRFCLFLMVQVLNSAPPSLPIQ